MNRHLRNIAAFAFGVLISFLLILPSAYAGSWPLAGPGSTGVGNNVFRSGPSGPTTTYTVSQSTMRDITSDATDITISRGSPFTSRNRYGDIATGEIIDAIKVEKSGLALSLRGMMKGGLIGLGMMFMQEYAMQKGFEWMEGAKEYYKGVPGPNPATPDYDAEATQKCQAYLATQGGNTGGRGAFLYGRFNATPSATCYCQYGSFNISATKQGTTCSTGYTMQNGVCTKTLNRASDADIASFIDDLLANAPERAIKDLIAKGIPVAHTEKPTKSLAAPVITLPRNVEKTTTPNPDGTTTTKSKDSTTETKIAPTGELSQTEKVAETTTTKDSAGNTTSSSTSTTETKPEVIPDLGDPSMPTVPSLYTQKYPNGLQGVWDAKKAALQNTAFVQSISLLAPTGWTTGTCPSWTLNFDINANMAYGNQVFPFPCWLVPFLKAALLLTAAFTARKLIWG